MSEYRLHSLILAADYPVDDVDEMWAQLNERQSHLAEIDAHHVVVYSAMWGPSRVLVTIGVRCANSIREILRSPAVFELFDISGVDEIPAVFAGEVVEKIDLYEPSLDDAVAGVIVGVVTSVDDVPALMVKVHDAAPRFRQSGVRKIWVYKAFDDSREVMILQEIADEISARRWINHPDAAAEWMSKASFGVYPNVIVGRFAHLMAVEAKAG